MDGTTRLIVAAQGAGIDHFLYVSIVGVERTPLPYARLKLGAETLVRRSALPWSVVRATQFYWLLDRMLGNMMRLPVVPLPVELAVQPADTSDFARYLAECAADGPGADPADFGGPEVLSLGWVSDVRIGGQHSKIWNRLGRRRVTNALYAPAGFF